MHVNLVPEGQQLTPLQMTPARRASFQVQLDLMNARLQRELDAIDVAGKAALRASSA